MTHAFLGKDSELTRGVRRGSRFARVSRDLFVEDERKAVTFHDLDVRTRVEAALTLFPGSVLGGRTAFLLTGVPIRDDGQVHLMRKPEGSHSERKGIEVHRTALRDDDVMDVEGRSVVRGPRALADLAGDLTLDELVAAGDVLAGRYPAEEFARAITRAHRRRGVVVLRQAVPLFDSGSASPAETRARLRLHAAGFTAMVHKVIIRDKAGRWLAEADLGDPVAKVALQHEGKIHFEKGEEQRIRDITRDDGSRSMGWQVVNSTKLDDRQPGMLIRKITEAYYRAAQLRGVQVLPDHLVESYLRGWSRHTG